FNSDVMEFIKQHDIRQIVLASRWNVTFGRPDYELGIGERQVFFNDKESVNTSLEENLAAFKRSLERTLKLLHSENREIVIVLQPPYVGRRVPQYVARRSFPNEEISLNLHKDLRLH